MGTIRSLCILSACAALAACGGGGGGGVSPISPSIPATPGWVTTGVPIEVDFGNLDGAVTFNDDASITLRVGTDMITIDASDVTAFSDEADVDRFSLDTPTITGGLTELIVSNSGLTMLMRTHSNLSYGVFGDRTSPANLPVGSMSYTGDVNMTINGTGVDLRDVRGVADIDVTFGVSPNVRATMGDFVAHSSGGTVALPGSLSSASGINAIGGTVYNHSIVGSLDIGSGAQDYEGDLGGSFYGPNAEETAGFFEAYSTGASPFIDIVGGFQAARP